jgi:hypothetical protein
MRIEILKVVIALFVLLGAASAAEAETATFSHPSWMGDRLDWCVNWSESCGKPAADAFCKAQGFAYATSFARDPNIGSFNPTRLIGSGAVCDQDMCDGFRYITCYRGLG